MKTSNEIEEKARRRIRTLELTAAFTAGVCVAAAAIGAVLFYNVVVLIESGKESDE